MAAQRGSRSPTTYHIVRLREPEDVDDVVQAWLTEAYERSVSLDR